MKNFLKRKGISLSPKVYFIDALGSMAFGLFATLLVGTILNTIGKSFDIKFLSETIWPLPKKPRALRLPFQSPMPLMLTG